MAVGFSLFGYNAINIQYMSDSKSKPPRIILLDAHAILHRAYHALPEFVSSKGEPTGGLYGLSTMLIKIISDLKPDYLVACFDLPKPTHRHEMYKEYKAGRVKADDALVAQMKRSRDVFTAFGVPIYDHEGFEADDILGTIVQKELVKSGRGGLCDIIIASGDMDTLQLVHGDSVRVYTLKKGINDTVMYDEKAVRERFGFGPELLPDYKGLRGDPSDNIIGIKGIGEKSAGILIQKFGALEDLYKVIHKDSDAALKLFKEAGLTERIFNLIKDGEEEALFSKILATIRKDAPIEFVLPAKTWQEDKEAHLDSAKKLFAELDFRGLGARMEEVVRGKPKMSLGNGDSTSGSANSEQVPAEIVDPEELREAALALWVTDSNITNPTLDDIYTFAKTRRFAEAKKVIFTELEKRESKNVYEEIELPLIPVLTKMREHGILIDRAYLGELSKQYHKELDSIQAEIWKYAGEEFNVASPKQLGEILFTKMGLKNDSGRQKKTATGAISTKESELEKLADAHPIIPLVMRYRELAKLLGTYIDAIPDVIAKDGRIHPEIIQSGAATGRMASQNPSVQNIPIKTEYGRRIRQAFIAAPGHSIVSIDYSQIELRIAAILSRDPKLTEIFTSGKDVHSAVASQVFGVPEDKVNKEMRRHAKVINFGILYGMGVLALRGNLSEGGNTISRADAQKFYDDYFANFSGLANYLNEVKAEANRKGYTETLFGRRRYFAGIRSKIPFIRASAERMAINAPIQGTNADITKLAMIAIDKALNAGVWGKEVSEGVHMLIPVHDEILFEIRTDLVAEVVPKIQAVMESALPKEKSFGIPIITEAHAGPNWGEMTKLNK